MPNAPFGRSSLVASHDLELCEASMATETIPFGLRRYKLGIGIFLVGGLGFVGWSFSIDAPMFVFPLGHLEASEARVVIGAIGVLALAYTAALSYLKFVMKPTVVLRKRSIAIPTGEFAQRTVTLRAGDVASVREGAPTAGGWRTCHVQHRGGTLVVHSAKLPDDASYFKVRDHLQSLVTPDIVGSGTNGERSE